MREKKREQLWETLQKWALDTGERIRGELETLSYEICQTQFQVLAGKDLGEEQVWTAMRQGQTLWVQGVEQHLQQIGIQLQQLLWELGYETVDINAGTKENGRRRFGMTATVCHELGENMVGLISLLAAESCLTEGGVQRQLECYRRTMFYAMESGIQRDIHICVREVWEQRKA